MESEERSTEATTQSKKIVDAAAMLKALDEMSGGPARRAMQTVEDQQGDTPPNNQPHDFEEK